MTTPLGRDLPCVACPHPAHFLPCDWCACTDTGRPGLYDDQP